MYDAVLTYGTFDLIHIGHIRLLQRLREMGRTLIVGCSTDAFNAGKGKNTVVSYDQRVEMLKACKFVDQVIPEYSWDQKRGDIEKYGVDLFAMGDDWAGKFDFLSDLCDVLYLPRTERISTTELKSAVLRMGENPGRKAG